LTIESHVGPELEPDPNAERFWAVPLAELLAQLASSPPGLSAAEARERHMRLGPNTLRPRRGGTAQLLWRQFGSPILLILAGATAVSMATGDFADGAIILTIITLSGLLGFFQERSASRAVGALLARFKHGEPRTMVAAEESS